MSKFTNMITIQFTVMRAHAPLTISMEVSLIAKFFWSARSITKGYESVRSIGRDVYS